MLGANYHISKNGEPGICKAKGKCPLGGPEQHFDNKADADKYSYKINSEEHGILPVETDPFSESTLDDKFPGKTEAQIKTLKNYFDKEIELYNETTELENASDEYKATDEYFDKVQALKLSALDKFDARAEAAKFTDSDDIKDYVKPSIEVDLKEDHGPNSDYNKHPDITDENFSTGVGPVVSAYSGKSVEEIKAGVDEIKTNSEESISLNEATRQYWNSVEQRTDKPIVCIDLETANPMDETLEYDGGQLTHIIETGAIKVHPDGTRETIDFTSGIPDRFAEHHGTGFTSCHNIEHEAIKDETDFIQDEAKQKKVLEFLDNSVMMAHNADFEIKQFTNSLRGFKGKVNDNSIEILDTMAFSKHMVPESEGNRNKNLVETAGLQYEGAHRAYQDADMSLSAFNILKNNRNEKR